MLNEDAKHQLLQARYYYRDKLVQAQTLGLGQPLSVGRQARDNTFVISAAAELPARAEVLAASLSGWTRLDDAHWRPRHEDNPQALGEPLQLGQPLKLYWRAHRLELTLVERGEHAQLPQQIEVPLAMRPLRMRAPSPALCGAMVVLAMVQISSVAKIKGQPVPWLDESLSWENPNVDAVQRQGQALPSPIDALHVSDQPREDKLAQALKTSKARPQETTRQVRTSAEREAAQQLPAPQIKISTQAAQPELALVRLATEPVKRWRPAPPVSRCSSWGCEPLESLGLEQRTTAVVWRANQRFRRCYETSIKRDPNSQGKLSLQLSLSLKGSRWRIAQVATTRADKTLGEDVAQCLSASLLKLSVPATAQELRAHREQPNAGLEPVIHFVFAPK